MEKVTIDQVTKIIEGSEHLKSLARYRDKTPGNIISHELRKLTADEITLLKQQGNICSNWDNILVADTFSANNIHHCSFSGTCVLGIFTDRELDSKEGFSLPAGLYYTTLHDAVIGNNCAIHRAALISHYLVEQECIILNTGSILAAGPITAGNGIRLSPGIESGGRELLSYAELTIPMAWTIASYRDSKELLSAYESAVQEYVRLCSLPFGIIQSKTSIINTGEIHNSFIGTGACIKGASSIINTTVLSSSDECTRVALNAIVQDSCLQWGSTVTSHAIVKKSVLMEYSTADHNSTIIESILGPNTETSEGEIISSLVGPFVAAHHQSLLIAALWPQGKGNIGYGANVGSNHTSKAPDQEIRCGEGLFFGLGVNIKFPSDFSGAPYSIIATGVDALPQKVEYPFSLINKPASRPLSVHGMYNEIMPAWVLRGNIFALKRNEVKFRKRDRSKRASLPYEISRPEIIDRVISARDRLSQCSTIKEVYTNKDIEGLGSNFMTEGNRKAAVEIYTFYIEYYTLMNLFTGFKETIGSKGDPDKFYSNPAKNPIIEHAREVLIREEYNKRSPKENMEKLLEMLDRIGKNIQRSKAKDDGRGKKIIPDYCTVHLRAEEDPFVKDSWQEINQYKDEIKLLLPKL